MRSAMLDPDGGTFEGNQNQWADHKKNAEQFGYVSHSFLQEVHVSHLVYVLRRYDADREAERWWMERGEMEVGVLGEEDIWSQRSRL